MENIKLKTFDKILGLEEGTFTVLAILAGIVAVGFLIFFFAVVFVDQSDNKVVERLTKKDEKTRVLGPGMHFIIPLVDKVVAQVSMTSKVFKNKTEISYALMSQSYAIGYTLVYKVEDAAAFFYSGRDFDSVFENKIAKSLIAFLVEKKILSADDFYKIPENELLDKLNAGVSQFGVKISEFTFTSVR